VTAQLGIFDQPWPVPPPASARVVTKRDRQRLGAQCAAMLTLLRVGPQLNTRLLLVACKYTSRISDLRLLGYVIACERVGDGVTRYTLISEPLR